MNSGEAFSYKRTNLNYNIHGENGEGVIVRINSSSNGSVSNSNALITAEYI